ncbi:MAG TPA: pyridoxamine 5'-phosphate oxidase family protein [Nitrososphaerales archaeon]|nr:pyridoxamine 5'-phosphate oxidase family protein [Nitrososphaerales archaeon]
MIQKSKLNPSQKKFLDSHEVGRLAVATRDGMPHVTPVIYAMDGNCPVIASDYGTRKLKILKENKKVSLVVDTIDPNKGVMIQGICKIFERGKEYLRLLKVLTERLEYYRENPWGEGESPILRITPEKIVSWGV